MIARCFFEQSRFDLADQIYSRIIKQTNEHTTIKECLYWKGLSHLLLSNDKKPCNHLKPLVHTIKIISVQLQ